MWPIPSFSSCCGPKRLVHVGRTADVDDVQLIEVDPGLVTRELKHRERLPAAEENHFRPLELAPRKIRIALPSDQKEAVHFIDLRKMHGGRRFASSERRECLTWSRLDDLSLSGFERRNCGHARWRDRPRGFDPFLLEEAAGHRGDEGRIEGREEGELDFDACHDEPPEQSVAR